MRGMLPAHSALWALLVHATLPLVALGNPLPLPRPGNLTSSRGTRSPASHGNSSALGTTPPGGQVLLFWPVGDGQRVLDLVRKNVAHVRRSAPDCCDVALHHYTPRGKVRWNLAAPEWYRREVRHSTEGKGFKFQVLRRIFLDGGRDWMLGYKYLWALDEDIDLTGTPVGTLLRLADASGAPVMGPALLVPKSARSLTFSVQAPRADCSFRYTNFVEVIAPLLRTSTLGALLVDCGCIGERTSWGLDGVWCGYLASRRSEAQGGACAVLDAAPVVHRDFKTLAGKYAPGGKEVAAFDAAGAADKEEVRRRFPQLFVSGEDIRTLRCVPAPSAKGKSARLRSRTRISALQGVGDGP